MSYHKHHVHGVFLQGGSEGGYGSESLDLRGYLTGELLWNPNQNVWTLVDEWLDAVHGKAAPLRPLREARRAGVRAWSD